MITNLQMSDSSDGPPPSSDPRPPSDELIGTIDLLERFKLGDEQAGVGHVPADVFPDGENAKNAAANVM